MCCAFLHLLIGVVLVLNVVAEEATNHTSTENQTETSSAPVSLFPNATKLNDTKQNVTDDLERTTAEITTFRNSEILPKSDLPTPPTVSEHPQTINTTTKHTLMMSTKASITGKKNKEPPTQESTRSNHGSTYVIILVIIIVCIIGGTAFCCLQKKSRRYSVDLHPKKEEAQIPLSTVDGEVFDSTPVKDMQTFSPVESNMPIKDPKPVVAAEKPDGEKEQSNTQAIVIPEDKAVELTIVDLTEGEMTISTKTSIETLDEPPNENNNNNTVVAIDEGHEFTEITLAGL
ncbi:uncharacterized protein si:dkey-27h10.2 isoform X2 [Triplophysa dalaica]|uniref:uncharacterized protein si:dkey-27h10.2 isoform X2 n=1 Tax=Triplophysa dalaica TaxID=1582913 RepID=UPI0024E0404B|nr:uncharacterized protein si:dkey-27h10.2 isoform X2 [Triplophysa dalaica]